MIRRAIRFAVFLLAFAVVTGVSVLVEAVEVTMPAIYADHMVIQTDRPIRLSGRSAGVSGELEIELAGRKTVIQPRLFGGWEATLDPVSEPGGSHTLTISAGGEVIHTLENITFGDVWICGGQSNMEWDMTTINDSAAEIAGADFPDIRLMEVNKHTQATPQDEVKRFDQVWTPCTPASVRRFSAVGYLFGRQLHQETGRPIGLVQSAWGGSRIETWIPQEALEASAYGENVAGRNFSSAQHKPSICYNAMIHGLAPLGIRGVIWYQGESNQDQPQEYRSLHETLITSWRELWGAPDLPFYFVQLANYAPGADWELLREAQTQTLAVPHTGMAVTIDIGTSNDIHPRNKQGTASRLAAIALAKSYDQDRVYSGPLFRSATTDGHDITLHFDHVGSGLAGVDGGENVVGFEALTTGGRWAKASARIVDGDKVVVPGTLFRTDPQGVRYGWSSDPVVSLENQEGFPAVPFRFERLELDYAGWSDQLVGRARLPGEDANGDGRVNLVDYASGRKVPVVIPRPDGGYELTFHRRAGADDVGVVLEESRDLKAWDEIWSADPSGESGSGWIRESDWGETMTDRYRITVPADAGSGAYYRVRYRLVAE